MQFRRFTRKNYGIFCSLHKVVNIGVVSAGTILFAMPDTAQGQKTVETVRDAGEKIVELEEVQVTASRAPIALGQAARLVSVISAAEIAAAPVSTLPDLLEFAAGVDVRQRGEGGTQSDISIRGGTFDQIAVLLNGVNLSNPQTGHFNFDLPVNLSDIERIEILSGPSSRVFGASAFAGAINIVTKTEAHNNLATENFAGSHGTWKVEASGNHAPSESFAHRLSAAYATSDGYINNTDYGTLNLAWLSSLKTKDADFRFQAGFNDKDYGANGFYSPKFPNQHDHTRRLLFSAGGETKGAIRVAPQVYWTKHFDNYELIRDSAYGNNRHATQIFGVNLNVTADWVVGRTVAGAEFRNEGILTTMGNVPEHKLLANPVKPHFDYAGKDYKYRDNRSHISYFLEHNLILDHFTLSAGLLAYYSTALEDPMKLYPGIDLSYRPSQSLKLYASWNQALRMPSFTDLYYKSEIIEGSAELKPEESEAFELGINYTPGPIRASLTGFYNKGRNMIDWVKYDANDTEKSCNLTKLNNLGFEANLTLLPQQWGNPNFFIRKAEFAYAYIDQEKELPKEIYSSKYALEYLKHKFTFQLQHTIYKSLSATWFVRYQDREGTFSPYDPAAVPNAPVSLVAYDPYAVVDLNLNWQFKTLALFAEANNLFDATYYDYSNLPQSGFTFRAGFRYSIR
ncbi:MAG: TonB-dependent receptor [Tannerellaceae bacterium]|nr:TonB-dependent receptor [Tannerellaceae bacterium]